MAERGSVRADERLHRALDQGNGAQQGQPELGLHILGQLDRVVELIKAESERESEQQTEPAGESQVQRRPRLDGLARHARGVDDRDVVASDAGDGDFLLPLEKAVVEAAAGVDVPPDDIVLDAAVLKIEEGCSSVRRTFAGQSVFVVQRDEILSVQRVLYRAGVLGNLAIDLVDLCLQLDHRRIFGFEGF